MSSLEFIKTPTRQLKTLVERYQKVLPEAEFLALIADIRSTYQKFEATLSDLPPGPARAQAGLQLITPLIEQGLKQVQPTCAKGCGACCHLEVEITQDEGELLAQFVVEQKFELDHVRLVNQSKRVRNSQEWAKGVSPENRCVFLGPEQDCQAYQVRPSACRKLLVASDPRECMTDSGKAQPIMVPFAEIAQSAILSVPNNPHASLSKSLIHAMKRNEIQDSALPNDSLVALPLENPLQRDSLE